MQQVTHSESVRRAYGRPQLVKRGKLALVSAIALITLLKTEE